MDPLDYQAYLARFDAVLGTVGVGEYRKHEGRLLKKLSAKEYAERAEEFIALENHFHEMVRRGDTLNNSITKLLVERRAELLLPPFEYDF